MTRTISTFAFGGGLDTNSAALAVPPGAVISAMNYEPLAEGYGRIEGYERFDGRTAPSKASFAALSFTNGVTQIQSGDSLLGAVSGATADVVIEPDGLTTGTIIITNVSGTFQAAEGIRVNNVYVALCAGPQEESAGASAEEIRSRLLTTMAWQRARIGKVPGEGPVRGVAVHAGKVYAWRDNVGQTRLKAYEATAAGWVAMGEIRRIPFVGGNAAIAVGDTVTGGTSGATGTVVNVLVETGSWESADAAGFIDVSAITGTFQSEALEVGGTQKAAAGASTAHYPAPGGRVRWLSHNFYGSSDRYRLYGCNGTGKAFELIPGHGMTTIDTGMNPDKPQRPFEINNHLGFSFAGGSLQFSGTLEPQSWTVITGAGEIGFGTDITDIIQANETAVAIFGEQKIGILQGTDAESFVLDTLTEEAGAEPDTAQRIARTVYLDRRGLRDLSATQMYGNFKAGSLTGTIERYFRAKRKAGTTPIGSYVVRAKSQYRLVWDDGTGLTVYMGRKKPEALPFSFEDTPHCFGQGELADGEGVFFGGEDGYVYRLESGNSHDGEQIRAFLMTGFNVFGASERFDRFHKVILELEAPATANIAVTVQYDYGDGQQPISGEQDFWATGGSGDFLVAGGGGSWDSAIWNEFYWSSPVEARAEAPIDGIGRNASFIFGSTAELDENPHILQAYIVHHSPRRVLR